MAKSETPARDAVIVKYLNEAYGKEKQLEQQLTTQIEHVKRSQLVKGFKDHLKVTKAQSRGLAKRIRELGGKADDGGITAAATNVVNRAVAAGKAPVDALRGTGDPDHDLRVVRDSLWHEAEEIAHYNTIEAVATELGDNATAKLAQTNRREEERMQKLLERQIPQLIKGVVKAEVPAAERPKAGGRRRSTARKTTRAASSRSTSRTSASRSAAASSRSTSASSSTSAKRSQAGKKAAATRARKSASTSAKSTATSARTTAKKAGTSARKAGSAARKTAGSRSTAGRKS